MTRNLSVQLAYFKAPWLDRQITCGKLQPDPVIRELNYIVSHWRDFEEDIGQLVEFFGYGGEVTRASGDDGVDVLARRGDRLVAIQCKLHEGSSVGSGAIQKLLASRVIHGATHFICFTTGTFTKAARELGGKTGTVLIDGNGLLTVCKSNTLTLRPRCFVRLSGSFTSVASGCEVGRTVANGLAIADPFVSSRHARFEREGLRLYLIDLASSNGTYVNETRIPPNKRWPITYGDRLRFAFVNCELTMNRE